MLYVVVFMLRSESKISPCVILVANAMGSVHRIKKSFKCALSMPTATASLW